MQKTKEELKKNLQEQIYLLTKSCREYDNGDHLEALRIATSLRTLLHDTNKSISLLNLLGIKDKILLLNTKLPTQGTVGWHLGPKIVDIVIGIDFIYPDVYLGLVVKNVSFDNVGPILSFKPVGQYIFSKNVDFLTWWNDIVFDNRNGITMTRKEIVLGVANKEGGTHIADLPKNFFNFKAVEVVKFRFEQAGTNYDSNPIYPTIRQIAFEFLESIK